MPTQFETHALVQRRDVEGTFCRVVTNEEGLFVNDVLCARRDEILGASISALREDGSCMVLLVRENKTASVPWYIDMPNRFEAEQLFRAAGLAPDQQVLQIRVDEWTQSMILMTLAIAFVFVIGGFVVLLADLDGPSRWSVAVIVALLPVFVIGELLVRKFGRVDVSVGVDGLLVKKFSSQEFVAFADVLEVNRAFGGFGVLDRTRGPVRIWNPRYDFWRADLVAMRIFEGMRAHRALNHHAEPAPAGNEGYRVSAENESVLEEVVIDSSRPLQVRVAAAETLRARAGLDRVRAIAATTVSPAARSALERVAFREDGRATI